MSVTQSGNPRDVQDFQFKNFCRLRVFQRQTGTYKSAVSLVATASKYDLIFVGCPNGFQVIRSSSIQELANGASSGSEITNYPRREIVLGSQPSHLNVSCDQNLLVVAVTKDGCAHAIIYRITSFLSKDVVVENEVRVSTKIDTPVLDLTWNPGIPNILAACLSDGSMAAYEFKQNSVDINTLPPATQATCFCWSPKGKQLVVGANNGTLTQYKPDLKAVKTFPAPCFGSGNVALVNVVWLSNYQFAGIYKDKGNPDERPGLMIVNAPKAGPVTFINYEDICYSAGELRPPQFYLLHQAVWNVLMVASANSMEVGVMGLQEDQLSWEQWTQEDAARAELPLLMDKQETYPVGMALDTSSQQELPWGENQTLPPMPVLHILSHEGLLCLFHTLNLRPDAPRLCNAPEPVPDQSGIALFVASPSSMAPPEQISKPVVPEANVQKIGFKVNLTPTFESIAAATSVQPVVTSAPVPAPASGPMFNVTPATSKPSAPVGFGMFNLPNTSQTPFGFLAQSNMKPAAPAPSAAPAFTSMPVTTSSSTLFALPVATTAQQPTPVQIPTAAAIPAPPPAAAQVQPSRSVTEIASAPAKVEPQKPSSISIQAFAAAIDEEMAHFEQELTQLRSRVNATNIQVGLHEEKVLLKQKVDTLEAFWRELKETTQGQTVEIHTLKSTLMEAFAWAEEAKSRAQQLSSPTYVQLVRSQGLDPITAHRAADIKHLVYYVENQLQQVNQQLDSRWIEFQESCNPSSKKKMKVPSLEAVYQTMVCQNNILNKQRDIMSDIARRAKLQGRNNNIPLISTTVLARARDKEATQGETELSRLAENLVQINLGSTEESRPLQHCRQLSSRKQAQLRSILTQRNVTRICATKPTIPPGGISGGRPVVKSPQSSLLTRSSVSAEKRQQTRPSAVNSNDKDTSYEAVSPPQTSATVSVDAAASASSYSFTFTQSKSDVPINIGMGFGAPLQKSPLMSLNSIVAGIGDNSASKTAPKPATSSQAKGLGALTSFSFSSLSNTQTNFGNTDIKKPDEPFRFSSNGPPATQILGAATKDPSTTTFKMYFNASQQQGEASSNTNIFGEKQTSTSIFAGSKSFTQTAVPIFGGSIESPQDTPVTKPAKETATGKETIAVTESGSLFGTLSAETSSKETPGNVFGKDKESKQPAQPVFGSGSESSGIFGSKSSSTIVFGDNQSKETSSTSVIFGGDKNNTSGGLFKLNLSKDSSTAPTSLFGITQTKEPSNIFGAVQAKEGLFGTSQSKDSPSSIFSGGQAKENTPSASIFGGASSAVFGASQTKDSPSSIFGGGQAKENISANIFSAAQPKESITLSTVTSASQGNESPSSISGGDQTKENTSTNIFGLSQSKEGGTPLTVFGTSQNKDASSNIVGSAEVKESQNKDSPSSIFGAAQFKESLPSNLFGTSQNKDSPSSIFGDTPTKEGTPSGSIFAGGQSKDTTPSAGIFTQSQNKDSPASIFGGSIGGNNIFGENKSKEDTNIFGGSKEAIPKTPENKTSIDSGNLFGNAASNLFGSLSLNKPSASEETTQQQPEKTTDDTKVTSTTLEASALEEKTSPTTITATTEAETKTSEETKTQTSSILAGSSSSFSFGQMAASLTSPTSTTSPQINFSFIQSSNNMPAKTSEPSVFGGATTSTTTTAATTTTTTATATTSGASEFTFSFLGTTTSSSVFGQKPLFGQPATTSTATTTVAPTTTAGTTFFGQPICSPSAFGQSGGSIFGQASTTVTIFGQAATTTTTSLFGGTTSSQTTTLSLFGGTTSSQTTTSSLFGVTTSAQTTSSSLFGQNLATPLFGQAASTTSAFGSTSGFGSKPTFGQSGGSIFGQSGGGFGSAGRSIFGGSTGGTSIFGGSSSTGGSTTGNLFQSPPSGGLFGSPATTHAGSPSGGGAFSSGVGTINQTGFGSPTAFQNKPGGFGASPVFGSTGNTGFGSSPTFGGAPTFGGSPTFGSPNKVFGSTSPAANVSFGSTGQQSSTFESLATQNTMTFGNLAQSQPQPGFGSPQQQSVFGASTQPTQQAFSSGNFGGSSFSSWR